MTMQLSNITYQKVSIPIKYQKDAVNPHFSFWTFANNSKDSCPILVYNSVLAKWIDLEQAKRANIVITNEDKSGAFKGILFDNGDRLIITGTDRSDNLELSTYLDMELKDKIPGMAGHVFVYFELIK